MKTKILLTSFQTWLPHQKSNSSDDLLAEIQKLNYSHDFSLSFLRNLPVNVELASKMLIAEIERTQPDVIICCGMAEKRDKLTLESNASCHDNCLYTSVNLAELTEKLTTAQTSHDAGKFVFEGLYYQILKYIQSKNIITHCLFAHIPLLHHSNLSVILEDFHYMFFWFKSNLLKKVNNC